MSNPFSNIASCSLRCACGAMFVLGIAALLGCGPSYPPRAPVSGVVTFRGEPVREGTITFFPTEGRSALGKIEPDGSYSLTTFETGDGAVLGEHQVTIKATKIHGDAGPKSFEEELARGTSGSGSLLPGEVEWIVPEEYANRSTSKLKATVKSGENQINFELPMN